MSLLERRPNYHDLARWMRPSVKVFDTQVIEELKSLAYNARCLCGPVIVVYKFPVMYWNNEYLITSLNSPPTSEEVRSPQRSAPCLISGLPPLAVLEREAEKIAPLAIIKQLKRSPSLDSNRSIGLITAADELQTPKTPKSPVLSVSAGRSHRPKVPDKPAGWKPPQPFEVFRAIERKDIMFLMEIRDHAFHLLLRKSGDTTPLLHAMRIGESHRDVAILLVGALSRYVNHLDDEDLQKAQTKTLLKALRTNLKLAIDYGLQRSQSDLVASYLQTLIMSEGEKWIVNSVASVSLALRSGNIAKPVAEASRAVRSFATRELNKAEAIAALDDYIANATFDLILMGVWSLAIEHCLAADTIPLYAFARDNRVYSAFLERIESPRNRQLIARKASRRLRWQIKVLEKTGESRSISFRRKIEILSSELDEGTGV